MIKKYGGLLISLILVLCVKGEMQCPIFKCGKLPRPACANIETVKNRIELTLDPCENDLVCDINSTEGASYCAETYSQPFRYPGEICHDDQECIRGSCDPFIQKCYAGIIGEKCLEDVDCNAGLFCNSKKICEKARGLDQDCESARCAAPFICSNNKCKLYGSLELGSKSTATAACKSHYIEKGICSLGPKLILDQVGEAKKPQKCKENCKYKVESGTITSQCRCGRTTNGSSYCNPGVGDLNLNKYFAYVNSMAEKEMLCHVDKGPLCLYKELPEMGDPYYEAVISFFHLTSYHLLVDTPDCLKEVIDKDYWFSVQELIDEENDKESFGMILFFVILGVSGIAVALMLFIRYSKNRADKADQYVETT